MQPHGYLTNLLGHKGPGSVFSLLSRNEWVNNTYLNSSVPGRGFGYLTIGLTLTVEGLKHVEEIVEIVFSVYITSFYISTYLKMHNSGIIIEIVAL